MVIRKSEPFVQHHLHTSTHTDPQRNTLMAPNILLTGVSGYLGGTLLNEWRTSGPKNYGTISALVRNDEQAKEVAKYGIEPLIVSLKDEDAIIKALVGRDISIVYYLIGSYWLESQLYFIKGLAEVKRKIGHDVHFLYVCLDSLSVLSAIAVHMN